MIDVPRLFRKALAQTHRFDGAFLEELREAARREPAALLAEVMQLPDENSPARTYPAWLLARHVEHMLATTPGIEQASCALRLALLSPHPPSPVTMPFMSDDEARRRWILARIAVRQPPDIAIEILERFEERTDTAPMIAMLTQELLTRNRVRAADHPVVGRLVREMRGRESPYAWLPEDPFPIETETVFPAIDESMFSAHPRLPPIEEADSTPERWPWGSATLIELEPPDPGVEWPRRGTDLELRAFQLPPASEGIGAASAIVSLPLDALNPPSRAVRTRSLTATEAFALFFHAAAADEGWACGFAAWPRLVAWKLVAALSGASPGASPGDIQQVANGLEWTRLATRAGWFDRVDLGWALLIAARDLGTRRIRVLAASRVEPKT